VLERSVAVKLGFRIGQSQDEFAALVRTRRSSFPAGNRKRGADVLRGDRQLPLAAVDQSRELDLPRTPVVEQLVIAARTVRPV